MSVHPTWTLVNERLDALLPKKLAELRRRIRVADHHRHQGTLDWAYPPFIWLDRRRARGTCRCCSPSTPRLAEKGHQRLKVSPLGNPACR